MFFLTDSKKTRHAYLIALVGFALTTVATIYRMLGTMTLPARPPGGNPQFGNMTMGNLTATNIVNPVGAQGFGLTDSLTIAAIIIALIGFVWLGLILLKPKRAQ